ncbi:MAG: M56 family metallopeptidase, partial [Bacteroidota bacterium]
MDFLSHYISEPLIHALGWTVLHSLWQGSLVAIVMALILSNLQKKSARLRYEIASLSLFLVFILSLSTFILLYESAEQQAAQAFYPEESFLLMQLEVQTSFFQDSLQRGVEYFNQSLPLIVTFWLVGALFFAMRLLGGLAYVQHLKYNDNELLPDFWQDQMRRLARQLRMKQHIELLESRLVTVPMVIGFFKPVILLPLGAINSLTEKEVEAILAHELAHIARYDFLLNIVLSLIEVLFYYHPAVWWISANVRLERENCCDDVAVQLCGNSLVYAQALVSLQEMSRHQPIPTFAMTLLGSQHQLLN